MSVECNNTCLCMWGYKIWWNIKTSLWESRCNVQDREPHLDAYLNWFCSWMHVGKIFNLYRWLRIDRLKQKSLSSFTANFTPSLVPDHAFSPICFDKFQTKPQSWNYTFRVMQLTPKLLKRQGNIQNSVWYSPNQDPSFPSFTNKYVSNAIAQQVSLLWGGY